MNDFYLTVRTVPRGQRGREALARAGLRCALVRAPRAIAPGGCAYALALRRRDGGRAEALLAGAGVPVEGRWLRTPAGDYARAEP